MKRDDAKKQVGRLSRLRGFPNTEESLRDMIDAMETAPTKEVAAAVTANFLDNADNETPCPLPNQLKATIIRACEGESKRPRCKACDGNKFISIPMLLTFHGQSMKIKNATRIESWERHAAIGDELAALGESRKDRQETSTAAIACACRDMGA